MPMRSTHPEIAATFSPVRRIGLAIGVVVALLLTLPAVAAAQFDVDVDLEAGSLTVTGDEQSDQIFLSVGATGKLAVNDEETTLARGRAVILVNAGGEDDEVNAGALLATDYTSMVVRGGPGNDFLVGGGADDTFVWANGDNSDEVVGAGGSDTLELTGHLTEADNLSFRASTRQPGWVFLRRQETPTVRAFEMELLDVETTAIHLEGGNDFTANEGPVGIGTLTHLRIDGGAGNDTLGGSNGADDIDGGPGNDLLAGAEGDDRLFGAAESDQLFGEGGDDQTFWANGDGSDEVTGGEGDDEVRLSGHPTEPDLLFFKPSEIQLGWVSLQREEAGPVRAFKIELLEVEDFVVDAMGGADLVAQDGPAGIGALTRLHVQGGPGADRLTGSDGSEEIEGGDGADEIFSRDGKADLVIGGPGADFAFTDALSLDDVREVETVDAAPEAPAPEEPGPAPGPEKPQPEEPRPPQGPGAAVPDTVALLPALGKLSLLQSGKAPVATVPVTCPASEAGGCRTTVTVETAKAVRLGGRKAILRLGSARVDLAAGVTATAKVRLNRKAAELLERGKLPVRVRTASTDAAGNAAQGSLTRVLKPR
jgi:hypothetical protein